MQHRPFGDTGLSVPVVGMGTWKSLNVRGERDERDRTSVIETAINGGTTLFDTSPMYGESERVLGKALAPHRDNVIVADKVWTPSSTEGREQLKRALAWYGGSVDIYQIHNLVAWREHLPVLESLRDEGKVRVVGATHYKHSAFGELMTVMQTGRIGMVQIPYNALDREVEREILPLAQHLKLGVLVMEPLGSGALVRRSPAASDLERLRSFGINTWSQALLAWILSNPLVHCVIPATSKRERATENAAAGDIPSLNDETRDYIEHLARRSA